MNLNNKTRLDTQTNDEMINMLSQDPLHAVMTRQMPQTVKMFGNGTNVRMDKGNLWDSYSELIKKVELIFEENMDSARCETTCKLS